VRRGSYHLPIGRTDILQSTSGSRPGTR
jgi:hypothetical protein